MYEGEFEHRAVLTLAAGRFVEATIGPHYRRAVVGSKAG